MKKASMHGSVETCAKDFELSFHFTDTGTKSALLCLLEMALVEMVNQKTPDFITTKRFTQLLKLRALVSAFG